MKNLFTINELIEADPCEGGLGQLTRSLGIYSGPTIVTIDDLEPMNSADILWGLRLLPVSDHEQKVIAVKVAVYAAELVVHLTNDHPHATACLDAAKAWLDNPCEETREAAMTATVRAAMTAMTAAMTATVRAAMTATVSAAMPAAMTATVRVAMTATVRAARVVEDVDPTTTPKIKSYLINLIRELDQ